MAYINFENRTSILVLKAFEAAAFVNEYLRSRCEEEFENYKYDDALMFGCQIGCITPLADDQFKRWYIEYPGQIHRYNIDYLTDESKNEEGCELYFVDLKEQAYHKALGMYDLNWRAYRTYTLYYEWEG